MNCNKCGTPIIPGENTCRFCGTSNNFSKREEKHEIIGFDDIDYIVEKNSKEAEIIDFMIGEDEVSLNDEEDAPVVIDDLIKEEPVVEQPVVEEVQQEVVTEAPLEEAPVVEPVQEEVKEEVVEQPVEEEKVVNSVIEEPPTARIPVEEVQQVLEEPEEEVKMEPTVNLDATTKMAPLEEAKKEIKKETKEEAPKKGGVSILTVLLAILLIASLIVNYFLFTGKSEIVKPKNTVTVSESTTSTVVYNGFETKVPSSWTVNSNNEDYLLLSDESDRWQASISLTKDVDYSLVSENTSNITDALGLDNYLFTSDYNKTANNHEFYIFKGKYFEYTVYVIATEVSSDTVALVDLKFTGEVEENVLNSILDSLANAHEFDETPVKENFEFKNLVPSFKKVVPKESE